MRIVLPVILLFVLVTIGLTGDKIPIPDESADYLEKYVVEDPGSGDDVICNQILLVFAETIDAKAQRKILKTIKGTVIGGIPAMEMYQIGIENSELSLNRVEKICRELETNELVIHATPRKVPTGNISMIELENPKPVRRRGELNMTPAERAAPIEEDLMVSTLSRNKSHLYDCLKNTSVKQGSIEYRITIDPQGAVSKIKILASSFTDKNLKDCLAHKIRMWDDFPEYEKDYERQLEFSFIF